MSLAYGTKHSLSLYCLNLYYCFFFWVQWAFMHQTAVFIMFTQKASIVVEKVWRTKILVKCKTTLWVLALFFFFSAQFFGQHASHIHRHCHADLQTQYNSNFSRVLSLIPSNLLQKIFSCKATYGAHNYFIPCDPTISQSGAILASHQVTFQILYTAPCQSLSQPSSRISQPRTKLGGKNANQSKHCAENSQRFNCGKLRVFQRQHKPT